MTAWGNDGPGNDLPSGRNGEGPAPADWDSPRRRPLAAMFKKTGRPFKTGGFGVQNQGRRRRLTFKTFPSAAPAPKSRPRPAGPAPKRPEHPPTPAQRTIRRPQIPPSPAPPRRHLAAWALLAAAPRLSARRVQNGAAEARVVFKKAVAGVENQGRNVQNPGPNVHDGGRGFDCRSKLVQNHGPAAGTRLRTFDGVPGKPPAHHPALAADPRPPPAPLPPAPASPAAAFPARDPPAAAGPGGSPRAFKTRGRMFTSGAMVSIAVQNLFKTMARPPKPR
jgi:hypothetical protein